MPATWESLKSLFTSKCHRDVLLTWLKSRLAGCVNPDVEHWQSPICETPNPHSFYRPRRQQQVGQEEGMSHDQQFDQYHQSEPARNVSHNVPSILRALRSFFTTGMGHHDYLLIQLKDRPAGRVNSHVDQSTTGGTIQYSYYRSRARPAPEEPLTVDQHAPRVELNAEQVAAHGTPVSEADNLRRLRAWRILTDLRARRSRAHRTPAQLPDTT